MFLRRSPFVAALALAAALVSGCAAEPPSEPTPGFASEEEAFAAAEATYRAYVDALNGVDLSDPATFEPVFALTIGEANAGARSAFSEMHADQLSVSGKTHVSLLRAVGSSSLELDELQFAVCLDVSDVNLVYPSGESAVSPDRHDIQSMEVTLTADGSGTYLIEQINGRDGEPRCSD